jgi:hypothetical protein
LSYAYVSLRNYLFGGLVYDEKSRLLSEVKGIAKAAPVFN